MQMGPLLITSEIVAAQPGVGSSAAQQQQPLQAGFFTFQISDCSPFPYLVCLSLTAKMTEENSNGKRKRSRSQDIAGSDEAERCIQRSFDFFKHYSEPTDEERISISKSALRDHIGASPAEEERRSGNGVLFFIEIGPASSRRGAACQHATCKNRIKEGSYRIAVFPGMNNVYQSAGRSTLMN